MTLTLETNLRRGVVSLMDPPPDEKPSDWCERPLPDGRSPLWIPPGPASAPGPFTFAGREYTKIIVDFFSDPMLADLVACFGSQLGKSVGLMSGLAAKMVREAIAGVWAMPTRNLARSFSKTRWMKFVEASAALKDFIPRGARRHDWAALEQQLGASLLNFVWSNSPAELSSRPAEVAVADEIDKFSEGTDSEADAVNLLEQRTKDFPSPKRAKTSTPTTSEGPIWQEFLKGDQCRYFVPCPHCNKQVVFVWSKTFTVFRIAGNEAFICWDKEARSQSGRGWEGTGWDVDRVIASAHAKCPHCGGHIRDGHKTQMVRDGIWTPTRTNAPVSFKSLHLPSMYGSSPETRFGRLAQKFIEQKHGLLGLRGFINGELAEPDEGQATSTERVEIISPVDAKPIAEKTIRYIGADYQEIKPHWAVCREFDADGNSRLIEWFTWENWNELRAKQIELKVEDADVGIDTGHKATEVYAECARYGRRVLVKGDKPGIAKSEWFGWQPMKGRERTAFWQDKDNLKHLVGIAEVADFPMLQLLEFNGHYLKDIFDRLRKGKTKQRCEFNERANDDYWRQLDGEVRKPVWNPKTKRVEMVWEPRTKRYPIHLKDCEIEIEALVIRAKILKLFPEDAK